MQLLKGIKFANSVRCNNEEVIYANEKDYVIELSDITVTLTHRRRTDQVAKTTLFNVICWWPLDKQPDAEAAPAKEASAKRK